jgi:hypothetical protein
MGGCLILRNQHKIYACALCMKFKIEPMGLVRYFMPGLSCGRFRTDGRTDGRTMAAGASVTWTHCSVLFEVTWGKTAASARTGSVQAMDAKGLYKGSSNVPFSLPSSPWPREATVCLVHFVVWAVIKGSVFWSYLSLFADQVFFYWAF